MQRTGSRKLIFGGFAAGVVLLATASMALACVQVIGTLTVTGTNGGTSVAIGNGTHPPYNMYCSPPINRATAPRSTSFATRPLVAITYGPSSDCNPIPNLGPTSVRPGRANTPSDGTYEVNFCPGQVFLKKNGVWSFKVDPLPLEQQPDVAPGTGGPETGSCFFSDSPADRGVLMGTMTVAGGSGSASLRIPAFAPRNQPNNASGIAVRRSCCGPNPAGGPPDVNLVPISII